MILTLTLALVASAPAAPRSTAVRADDPPIHVWLNSDNTFTTGDRARVHIRAEQDGYVVVLRADGDGRVRVLFPLDPGSDDFVRGGDKREVRSRGDREAFLVDEREGSGVVLAAWSATAFKFDEFVRGDHWDYRALDTRQSSDDKEAALVDAVQRMAGENRFDYDVVTYTVGSIAAYYNRPYYGGYGWGGWGWGGWPYGRRFRIGIGIGYPYYGGYGCDPFWGGYGWASTIRSSIAATPIVRIAPTASSPCVPTRRSAGRCSGASAPGSEGASAVSSLGRAILWRRRPRVGRSCPGCRPHPAGPWGRACASARSAAARQAGQGSPARDRRRAAGASRMSPGPVPVARVVALAVPRPRIAAVDRRAAPAAVAGPVAAADAVAVVVGALVAAGAAAVVAVVEGVAGVGGGAGVD